MIPSAPVRQIQIQQRIKCIMNVTSAGAIVADGTLQGPAINLDIVAYCKYDSWELRKKIFWNIYQWICNQKIQK
ncbi:MAG: hypothetical protein EZS28_014010 [Streblomastix strix]|uniref:Uncharacterized protein n=1 Tax=Streblomastix strix TaxID=222440 RepID=A0A5J4W6Z8_9EUKA|nr:MAG: hypothetical protein EZS28_014010 [Streblomastix strix]